MSIAKEETKIKNIHHFFLLFINFLYLTAS